MPNLEQHFRIAGRQLNAAERQHLKEVLSNLEGINQVEFDPDINQIILNYTPGMVNVQILKTAIETLGIDLSDRGDD
ncbi:MAG TPA: hypothetical protein VIM29_12915 [Bacillota bacterium]